MSEIRIPTYDEALLLLAQKAQEGSVTAIVALERALRGREEAHDEVGEMIDKILNKAD
jgi:hypothetical protein